MNGRSGGEPSPHTRYSKEEMRALIDAARSRGIRVIPEVDVRTLV